MILKNDELEELENKYLEKYSHFFKYSLEEILVGLSSKEKIKDDWFDIWNKDKNKKQSYSVGAERVIYYYLSTSKGLGEPNSSPVSSDLMFETSDAFIHIDLKTVQLNNIGDISNNIFVGNNQNSYESNVIVSKNQLLYKPNLPIYYTCSNGIKSKKPCLTYLITILHNENNFETLMIAIMCIPNGQLSEVYGEKVLSAGKTVERKDREKGRLSTIRFNYTDASNFKLLNNKKRIEVIYLSKNIPEKDLKKISFIKSLYENK